MIMRLILMTATILCTYAMVQIEMQYYDQPFDFYLNMMTHFLGGLAVGLGVLLAGDVINNYFPETIPDFPLFAMVFTVLMVGFVWEMFEVAFRNNMFFTQDTIKDLCMDILGAMGAYMCGVITRKNA